MGYAFLMRNYRSDIGKWQTSDPLGYPDGWNNYAYVNNMITSYIDLLGAWGENVHQGETAQIAAQAGFSTMQATRIANANNGTDSLWGGNGPWGAGSGDSSRHFNYSNPDELDSRQQHANQERQNAIKAWNEGRTDDALDALGRALHSLQDIDAHRDWDPRLSLLPDWNAHPAWYDDVDDKRNETALKNTREQSRTFLDDFRRAIGLPVLE